MLARLIAGICALIGSAWATEVPPPENLDELDRAIAALVSEGSVPGASIAIVENGAVTMTRAYGIADIATNEPMRVDTRMKAGSVSKNVTSLLALILDAEGSFDIDAPLRTYLPDIGLDNPYANDHPILIKHLLSHTAGIEGSTYNEYATSRPRTSPTAYTEFIAPRLKVRWRPGQYFSYANSGHTLVAAAMEAATGVPFDTLIEQKIFIPLDIQESIFFRTDRADGSLAKSYGSDGRKEQPHWDMMIRPSGALITTPRELAKIVVLYTDRGATLLAQSAIEQMETPALTLAADAGLTNRGYGLGNIRFRENGQTFQGHGGSTEGFRTHLGYHVGSRSGYVIMMNADDGTSYRIRRLIASYLTRDTPIDENTAIDTPSGDDVVVAGWYRPFTEDMLLRSWLWSTFAAVKVRLDGDTLTFDPVIPLLPQQRLTRVQGNLFAPEGELEPSLVFVRDEAGRPVLVDDMAFRYSNAAAAAGPFYVLTLGILTGLISIGSALFRVVRSVVRSNGVPVTDPQVLVGCSGGCLVITTLLVVHFGASGDWGALVLLGTLSWLSVLLFVLTIAGPLFLAGSIVQLIQYRDQIATGPITVSMMVGLLGVWLLLGVFGWVPLVTFRA
ncbi:MAG: serine hydrolase domain-containing protein [Pseudomonadota bacterium]